MTNEEDYLQLSGVQHFLFCRRQWALIHIEKIWNENVLTVEGQLIHERTHDSSIRELRNDCLSIRGMSLKSDKLSISGQCDVVEFHRGSDGVKLNGYDGLWSIVPIEYKHGSMKVDNCDRAQLALQVMCLEEMFSISIPKGYLYYYEIRHRECVEINEELRAEVLAAIIEMQSYYSRGYTPKVKQSKKCKSCSLYNMCIPSLSNKRESASQYITKFLNEI